MINSFLSSQSLPVNFIFFIVLAIAIWIAGTQLSYILDAIADKTKIARAFLGLIFLALATSLPEIVITVIASINDAPELALNNMFGSIVFQTVILALVDMSLRNELLTNLPITTTPILEGIFVILLLIFILTFNIIGDIPLVGTVGVASLGIGIFYLTIVNTIKSYESNITWRLVDLPEKKMTSSERKKEYEGKELNELVILSLIASVVILAAGIILVPVAEALAMQTGLGNSFIGVSMLAVCTSLPELSTTFAAVRIKAYSMAIANVFGSNLIMAFLIFPTDIFYSKGLIINEINKSAQFAIASGIIVTALYCAGFLHRKKEKNVFGVGIYSLSVLAYYIFSLVVLYYLR